MASRELYSSIAKPKKKLNFGQQIGEYGKVMADTALSGIGGLVGTDMSNIIDDDAYKADWAKKVSSITSPLANVTGSIAPMLMGAPAGPAIFAKGGLRTFEGNSHEQGGIKLGADEVENNESMFPIDNQTDFIFSDRITVPGSKQSFAAKSKRISKKYSLRPNDPYGKKSEELELKNLAELQEAVKTIDTPDEMFADGGIHIKKANRGKFTKSAKSAGMGVQEFARHVLANKEDYSPTQVKRANFARNAAGWQHAMGGKRYDGGGVAGKMTGGLNNEDLMPTLEELYPNAASFIEGPKNYEYKSELFPFTGQLFDPTKTRFSSSGININKDKPFSTFNKTYNPPLVKGSTAELTTTLGKSENMGPPDFDYSSLLSGDKTANENDLYQSNFTLPALGYAAQALTNIPALFTKPETINSSRVKFDRINLAEQRNEARRARNLGLATARGIGATDAGQMMNYLSGTTAALNSAYGNQFNQSLLQEQQANAEMNMREQLANSEIERYDEQINAQERDAARALRMNALQNLGTIAAGAGKDYMAMQESDAMMNVLMGSNPDFTFGVSAPTGRMKWLKSKTLTSKRRKE